MAEHLDKPAGTQPAGGAGPASAYEAQDVTPGMAREAQDITAATAHEGPDATAGSPHEAGTGNVTGAGPGGAAGSADGVANGGAAAEGPAAEGSAGEGSAGEGGGMGPAGEAGLAGVVPDTVEEVLAEAEAGGLSELDVAQRERDDYLDALRRLQADFENFRKRSIKQQTGTLERAAQTLVDKLLPVLDAADLAIAHGAGEAVAQVAGLLMDTLVREGLEGVDPKPGEAFDPTVHEAVAHEPGDVSHPEVADLLRAGYRWKGALLRPAMVKVRG